MIYIVEDDENIREIEHYALRGGDLESKVFSSAKDFWQGMQQALPKLIVLDIMLPGEDGFSILRKLKESALTASIPVMMVTAKSTELDCVRGLDAGADDYLPKPFGVMEFLSRIKALLRRSSKESLVESIITYEGIVLDDVRHTVSVNGDSCILTFKEYELLKLLISSPGIVFSRELILQKVWECDSSFASRTVDMHVKTLRQKLGDKGALIKTIRNVGYKVEV